MYSGVYRVKSKKT